MTPEEREAWLQARCGKVGASMIHAIMARTKSGYSASRDNYMSDLLIERLTGRPTETYQSEAMLHGINTEPQAKAFYELETGNQVVNVGFMLHPEITEAGASPDGLIGDDGLIEVKCKNTANHIDFLLNEKIEQKHIYQMQWQMEVTGRKWCDFVSFDNRLPERLQMKIVRVERNDSLIAEIKDEVIKFLGELDEKLIKLEGLTNDN
jgi:putative phage-type endonuclease